MLYDSWMPRKAPKKTSASDPAIVCRVNPTLAALLVPIADLREDPDNANKHGERSLEDIATSFREFGQQKPLIFKKGGTVVAGNGGFAAARSLGWTHVAAIQFDGPSEAARAFAIMDNRSAEHSERDDEVVGRQLRDLAAAWEDFKPELVGYTVDEASNLPGGYGELPEELPEEGPSESEGDDAEAPADFKELDSDLPYDYECPKCAHVWSGKARS